MGQGSNGGKPSGSVSRQPPARGASAPAIYERLKRDILDMVIAPGEPLDETSLSARFGKSRTPVREAMVRLVAEGYAKTLPNRNTIVTGLDFASLPDYLDALMLMYRVTTRAAAQRRTDHHLEAMRAAQAAFEAAVVRADAMDMIRANRDFHVAIAAGACNRYYLEPFTRLLDEGTRLLRLYYWTFEDHLPKQFVDEHRAMIAAIEARDADQAEDLGRQHAEQIIHQLKVFLDPRVGRELRLARPEPTKRAR